MPFRYEAYNREGQPLSGVLPVDSEDAAERLLWGSDLTIVKLKKASKPFVLHEQLPTLFGVKPKDIIDFANRLAFLVRAGINLYTALQLLRDQTRRPALRAALSSVVEDVGQGATLSGACGKYPAAFPVLFVRMIRVGEETGHLDLALEKVAAYMERQRAAMQKVAAAMTYPLFVMAVAGIAMVILITVALPNLLGLFNEFNAQLPLPTRILIFSMNLAGAWGLQAIMVIGAIAAALVLYRRTPEGKRRFDFLLIGAPLFGQLILKLSLARITDTMASLMSGGVPLAEVLDLLVDTTQNRAIREPLMELRTEVLTGSSLSQSAARYPIFPPMMVNLLAVAEQAGTLEDTLLTLAALYDAEANQRISSLLGLLEPLLTLGIGAVIGYIAITIIGTIYSVLPQIH
ncbi:MAG: type II secretion system F family protein [Dehalococcoidia bacterium]|nr:type II secretion system F family protein [Dehalococcoidia bacterium]